jgi:transcriptional regulator GlxA family with amidase domain
LRIRESRRLLERTTMPIDEIGFVVGYENTAFFRRLFQRTTRLPPGSYRRKFGVVGLVPAGAARSRVSSSSAAGRLPE